MGDTILRFLVIFLAGTGAVFVLVKGPEASEILAETLNITGNGSMPSWYSAILYLFYALFILGAVFPAFLFIGFMSLAPAPRIRNATFPFITVIIPAFNEEEGISKSLKAAASLDYPAYEVIVVDDGSTDFTMPLIERTPVSCIRLRKNCGKAAALNVGIAQAKGEIIVFSDSDSWLHPQALRYLARRFSDPAIGAVSGKVVVDKPVSLLQRWQMIEYLFGQAVVKVAQVGSGQAVVICPGPIAAYRRDLLMAMNGYKTRTLTEDFDASLDVIRQGYRIAYEPQAVAFTNTPLTWRELFGQRVRWSRGNLQVFREQKKVFFDPASGPVGFFWLPFYYLFIGYGCGLIEILLLGVFPFLAYASGQPLSFFKMALLYFLLVESFSLSLYLVALARERQLTFSFLLAALLISPYRLFLSWVKCVALGREIRGKESLWS